jgi:hypothetical protein
MKHIRFNVDDELNRWSVVQMYKTVPLERTPIARENRLVNVLGSHLAGSSPPDRIA